MFCSTVNALDSEVSTGFFLVPSFFNRETHSIRIRVELGVPESSYTSLVLNTGPTVCAHLSVTIYFGLIQAPVPRLCLVWYPFHLVAENVRGPTTKLQYCKDQHVLFSAEGMR